MPTGASGTVKVRRVPAKNSFSSRTACRNTSGQAESDDKESAEAESVGETDDGNEVSDVVDKAGDGTDKVGEAGNSAKTAPLGTKSPKWMAVTADSLETTVNGPTSEPMRQEKVIAQRCSNV